MGTIIIGSLGSPASLEANFSSNVSSGVSPLTVHFTDTSVGDPTINSWFWDFGDGHYSNEQNPTNVFNNLGLYNVILTVSNEALTDDVTKKIYVSRFEIYPVMYVDFNRKTYGHKGTYRDNFSLKDLQEFFDFLALRPEHYSERIIIKYRGRTTGKLVVHDIIGTGNNLLRFESSDTVNDPGILIFDESFIEAIEPPYFWDLWIPFDDSGNEEVFWDLHIPFDA